ncbi:uncharacterized protein CMU_034370 [Cryptosporidium muris RN66]|uniref:Thioesterase domain-containing protein n=1 Tax=Cryptosporidium muris (strain RN66) TaxID=441375 RepID=B6AFR0_CRYMR|nr:uncharacterized protein CMU_034370 [Cryptosporidium muris RN66]EEA07051.1 hypothetical protein, conserved [Cryptosporidium muris RN66]|eukprot:XP_002141400.1 hypothetical protein [Cryptosporidium muris RN66]
MSKVTDFQRWFPSYSRVNAHLIGDKLTTPSYRILCIPGAGSTDQIFVQAKAPGAKNVENTLLKYAEENNIEILAMVLPGRAQRSGEEHYKSIIDVINDFYPVFEEHFVNSLDSSSEIVPWILISHSMGGLIAFELLKRLKYQYIMLNFTGSNIKTTNESIYSVMCDRNIFPQIVVIMSTVSPDTPKQELPWNESKNMNTEEFKEECRRWGINNEVFRKGIWEEFEPLLRSDFHLFDSYNLLEVDTQNYSSNEAIYSLMYPLGVRKVQLWSATEDKRATKSAMYGWIKLVACHNGDISEHEIQAGHNFLHNLKTRNIFMDYLCSAIDVLVLEKEYY